MNGEGRGKEFEENFFNFFETFWVNFSKNENFVRRVTKKKFVLENRHHAPPPR